MGVFALSEIVNLIARAKQAGINLVWKDGELKVLVPKGETASQTILSELRDNKENLITYFTKYRQQEADHPKAAGFARQDRTGLEQIPLSFAQERLWFIDQMDGSVQYHIPTVLHLTGPLNVEALTHALSQVILRHEVLRTVIVNQNGTGIQLVKDPEPFHLDLIPAEQYQDDKDGLIRFAGTLIRLPFNLSKDLMLRAWLLELAPDDHVLVASMHHIASDAWSSSLLINEVTELYRAFLENRAPVLPELEIQYSDFAIWQRNTLQGEILDKKLAYWKDKLSGYANLELPTDFPRPQAQSNRGANYRFTIPSDVSEKLLELAYRNGASLYMVMLTAYSILLSRYSRQDDIVVGTSMASRDQREFENLIGFFVSTLALRNEIPADKTFTQVLMGVKKTMLEAYEHQDMPFEKIVDEVVTSRDPSRNPLFQVMLVMAKTPDTAELSVEHLEIEVENYEPNTSKFELTFFLNETPDGIRGLVQYATDLFSEPTISYMVRHFINLLGSIVQDPYCRISELQMTDPQELLGIQERFSSSVELDERETLTGLFQKRLQTKPDAVALTFNGQLLTFSELDNRSDLLASGLQSLGVRPGAVVPLCTERGPDMLVGILGILKAGAAYLPMESDLPANRAEHMIRESGSSVLVCSAETKDWIRSCTDSAFPSAKIIEPPGMTGKTGQLQPVSISATDPAYVIYTSGSTGLPKGVVVTHQNVVDYLTGLNEKTSIETCRQFAMVSSFATDLGNTVLFGSWLAGGTLHLFTKEQVSQAGWLHRYFSENTIDCLKIVPSHWKALEWENEPLIAEKLLIFGGEVLRPGAIEKLFQVNPSLRVFNHYGPTETTIGKLIHEVDPEVQYGRSVPVGKPFGNTRIYVLDDQLLWVGPGVPGQLFIGGKGVSSGYLGNPDLTDQKFIPEPGRKEKMYATGDLVRYNTSGEIEFLGRIDEQVKIRGYRVEVAEVERLLEACPGVKRAVAAVHTDSDGNNRLAAWVIPFHAFEREQILIHLKETAPDYMVPVYLQEITDIPLLPNGKINRKALPSPEVTGSEEAYVSASDDVEERLVKIWEEILEVERVGVHDDFFELGGHSLLAIRLISAIRKEFNAELPIGDIFDYPTVAGLRERIAGKAGESVLPKIGKYPRTGRIPLSFSQERLWFIDRLEGSVQYHIPSVLVLEGSLDTEALERSFCKIVERHEVLRTVIREEGGEAFQQVQGWEEWRMERLEAKEAKQTEEWIRERIARPFDLSGDYMVRATLIRESDIRHHLVVVMHHIASDGWSGSVMVKELVELYRSQRMRRTADLPKLPVQYADFSIWQREYLSGETLEGKLAYWRDKLSGIEPLELPLDHPRPRVQSNRGAVKQFTIDKQLTQKLNSLSLKTGSTLFMTMLAAFKVLLYRYSGQTDLCVGTPVAGRQQRETEDLIGFFINTLALRTQIGGTDSIDRVLAKVKETSMEAMAHQEVPFEKVVEAVVRERDLSRSPLFQVLFVFQNTPDAPDTQLEDLAIKRASWELSRVQFELILGINETASGMQCSIQYCTDLYAEGTIQRMFSHLEMILSQMVADPAIRIDDMNLLTGAETAAILSEFNRDLPFESDARTVLDLFNAQVIKNPDKPAVQFEEKTLSYSGLDRLSDLVRNQVLTFGVQKDQLVPLCVQRDIPMIAGILGVLKAGAAYVPIDPAYPEERIAFILKDIRSSFILCDRASSDKLQSISVKEHLSEQSLVILETVMAGREETGASVVPPVVSAESLAYLIYTSGSTGQPKGVQIEHGQLLCSTLNRLNYYQSGGSFLLIPSFSFDSSVAVIFWSLTSGGLLRLSGETGIRDPKLLRILLRDTDTLLCVPSYYRFLVDENLPAVSGLKQVILAGEQVDSDLVEKHYGKSPQIRLFNEYGPTENTVWATVDEFKPGDDRIAIGKPLNQVRVLITRAGRLQPVGIPGEICLSGPQVARGYYNRDEQTNSRFGPFATAGVESAKTYSTGDLGRWLEDGRIEYLGRMDEQVKIRGYRIEPGEVESAILKTGLLNSVVADARPDPAGNRVLVAYYLDYEAADTEKLSIALRAVLPDFMIPSIWVPIKSIPLSPNGKVNRKLLPAPEFSGTSPDTYVAPENDAQKQMAEVWARVFNRELIGIHDNFFEIGGHSLLALKLISAIQRDLGMEIQLIDLMTHPTIAGLTSISSGQTG